MFDVIAIIGIRGVTIRIMAVADTPSSCGMIISMKIKSNRSLSWLILSTASRPFRLKIVRKLRHQNDYEFHATAKGSTYRSVDDTVNIGQKFGPDPCTRFVILDKQDVWFFTAP